MSNLKNRIGTVEISKLIIENADKDIMKAIFSEFYPIAIKEHNIAKLTECVKVEKI